ncbi:hypothetical protein DFH06DRAFT_1323575 [Mycena polygramma]|nr:hypothetical protein DFH06DRAFT_1323575 [Mycena polygramma]
MHLVNFENPDSGDYGVLRFFPATTLTTCGPSPSVNLSARFQWVLELHTTSTGSAFTAHLWLACAQHPRRSCATIIFLLPVRAAGTRTRALRAFAAHLSLLALGDGKNSTGFPPAETGWDLYLPSLERARARQGSVLQPSSLSTRTCGHALTFPEVDSSSALTNGPRFKYTLPWQLFCSKRPLRLAESRSCSTSFYLTALRLTHATYHPFLGLEMILKRSTTKSTALAFVRQLFPTHFALILRCHHPHELHRPSSQPSKTLGHSAIHACEAFVSTALAFLRNPDATLLLPAFVLVCQTRSCSTSFYLTSPRLTRATYYMYFQLLTIFQEIYHQVYRPGVHSAAVPHAFRVHLPGRQQAQGRFFSSSLRSTFMTIFPSSFISSHRSRPRLSATVLDMHVKLLAAIIFDFGIKNLHRARSLENTAAKDFSLPGLFLLRRPPLELYQWFLLRPTAHARKVPHRCLLVSLLSETSFFSSPCFSALKQSPKIGNRL